MSKNGIVGGFRHEALQGMAVFRGGKAYRVGRGSRACTSVLRRKRRPSEDGRQDREPAARGREQKQKQNETTVYDLTEG